MRLNVPVGLFYRRAAGKRLDYWTKAVNGWCDIALESDVNDNFKANLAELRVIKAQIEALNISASRIISGKRVRADKVRVRYSFFAPAPVDVPFIVSHYDIPQRPKKNCSS